MSKIGILLGNLGTPDAPTTKALRPYLKQFLSDPRVIDIPAPLRWLLVNAIILPTRPRKSAKAYQEVWDDESGSPLLSYSNELRQGVSKALGNDFVVEVGMRYGNPSIKHAISRLLAAKVSRIIVLPLFPQYASASTGSLVEEVFKVLSEYQYIPSVDVIGDFYDAPEFINAVVSDIKQSLSAFDADHILFSYHGVPERHMQKVGCEPVCRKPCPAITPQNRGCYRAQCFETTRAVLTAIHWDDAKATTAFQSRLGRTPWIHPYSDQILSELHESGVRKLAMISPSFTADCLETLEEINMGLREDWLEMADTDFCYIPCVNASSVWIRGVCQLIEKQLGTTQPSKVEGIELEMPSLA